MTHPETFIWIIALAAIGLMLARPRGISEAYWACGGALFLIATRLISLRAAAHAVREGRDVYLFLAGMMILAELARENGVFEWLADVAARHARQSCWRLFALIYLVGAVVTAFLSNDATAVVLTPAVLAVVRRAKVQPMPYLLACAFIANAASFVFPISNPANLVVFDGRVPALGIWLKIFALPAVASVAATFVCLAWMSRKELSSAFSESASHVHLSKQGRLALAGLVTAAVVLVVSSVLGLSLGLPTLVAALLATGLVLLNDRGIVPRIARGISWSVLPLVAGLFVIVEALEGAGLRKFGVSGFERLAELSAAVGRIAAAFPVAILSNAMNNLPVALMSGAAVQHGQESGVLAHAVLIGVDLGPNLSVTGSLATILWLIALRREGVEITAWDFFKIGIVAMPVALIASLLFLWS
jgi:arsenical pump membrane protein